MQGTWVRSLVWEDSTCHGATKPMCHSYWAHALELVLPNKRGRSKEKQHTAAREQAPLSPLERAHAQQQRTRTAKMNNILKWGYLYLTFCGTNALKYIEHLTWSLAHGKHSVAQLCPTLCDPMDCNSPGSSAHWIFQARILEWVAISYFRKHTENVGNL